MPKISVVVPLYNKANHVAQTIDSVLKQTFSDFELLVVNDGSTDGGERIVEAYPDARVRLINRDNGGESMARNTGIEKSTAKYVAFLDADDTWDSDFLEIIDGLTKNFPDAAGYATHIRDSSMLQKCGSLFYDPSRGDEAWMIENYFECLNSGYFPVTSSSVCVKRSTLIDIQGFSVNLRIGPDIDAWIRVFLAAGVAISNRYAATYHTDAENRSIHRPDFSMRELEFFEHLKISYLNPKLDRRSYAALNEWISKRIHQIVIRLIYQGNKRFAARVFLDHWRFMSGGQRWAGLARLCAPNRLVESVKKIRVRET